MKIILSFSAANGLSWHPDHRVRRMFGDVSDLRSNSAHGFSHVSSESREEKRGEFSLINKQHVAKNSVYMCVVVAEW